MPGTLEGESMTFHDSGRLDKSKGIEVFDTIELRRICLHCGYRYGYHYYNNGLPLRCPTQEQVAENIFYEQ